MTLDQVDKIDPQPFKTVVQAPFGTVGRVVIVPLGLAVSPDLGRQVVSTARDAVERLSQGGFCKCLPVGGRDVDKVDTAIDSGAQCLDAFVDIHLVKDATK